MMVLIQFRVAGGWSLSQVGYTLDRLLVCRRANPNLGACLHATGPTPHYLQLIALLVPANKADGSAFIEL